MIVWHNTDYGHSKVLEINPPHKLGEWIVIRHVGAGVGILYVAKGESTIPPIEISSMLRVQGMWRVISDPRGFFIITILEDFISRWAIIEAEIIQAYVLAKEKVDAEHLQRD